MLIAGKEFGLGIDVRGIHVISSAARFRTATRSGTLADGFAQIQGACGSLFVTLQALSTDWDLTVFRNPWHMQRCGSVISFAGLDHSDKRLRIPTHGVQAAAPVLLCEHKHPTDFASAISSRASNIFGAISRHRIAQVSEAFR